MEACSALSPTCTKSLACGRPGGPCSTCNRCVRGSPNHMGDCKCRAHLAPSHSCVLTTEISFPFNPRHSGLGINLLWHNTK